MRNLKEIESSTPPEWDLSDLYSGMDGQDLEADLSTSDQTANSFYKKYHGQVGRLSGLDLSKAVEEYEKIDEILNKIMSYAQLSHAQNMTDPTSSKFYQTMQERVTAISAHLVFFGLEINAIPDRSMKQKLKDKSLSKYEPWLRDLRLSRPHQLNESLERILHDKHVSGRAAWNRLFDETIARLRIKIGREEKTIEQTLNMLSDTETHVRKLGAKALGKSLGQNVHLFSLITNTLAKDKETEDRWRGYVSPSAARNLSNRVEDEVVDALVVAVKRSYANLSHRYYKLKASWFGKQKIDYWDRNAPIPGSGENNYSWDAAKDIVLRAYTRFSPELAVIGKTFFEKRWIDAASREGKATGAFAHPTVPSAHPYLLLNFMGRPRDVMTLAHELGHGVHQVLASKQGHLKCNTPLTLAETASVFGEMLTFRSMLEQEENLARRKAILASKVEDMLNTVVRQIAFYDFELRLHNERIKGELPADKICDLWLDVQTESLGPAIRIHEEYKYYWCYIPHFIHSPFYVYAYAFGDCLVNALYARYQEAETGFVDRYLSMLGAGGTLGHKELLAPFHLDASDPDFWSTGLGVVGGLIDELEEIG